jgi:Tfp pilus assembly protein FimT
MSTFIGSRTSPNTHEARPHGGFSLMEVLLVLALTTVMTLVAVTQFQRSEELLAADAAMAQVASQLRLARQAAIDQRRDVSIEFTGTSRIRVIRRDDAANNTTVLVDENLPNGYTFAIPSGASDTPNAYGNSAAVAFGGATGGTFRPDGSFIDAADGILSGTVFTMTADSVTARAVTVTGATGRVQRFAWRVTTWEPL